MTRVLIVHNRYRTAGGEERHIDILERSLPEVGVDVRRFEVASPSQSSPLDRLCLGAQLTYRPAGGRLLHDALATYQPDIVHFHNIFPILTPAALRTAARHGAGVVLTVHNYRFACPAGTLLRNGRIHEDCIEGSSFLCGARNSRGVWSESIAYGVALELQRRLRLVHRWVDAYVAPSNFLADMLKRAGYPRDRIHTIYHGTPIFDSFVAPGEFAFYAGRLSQEKGIETVLSASALVPQVPVVIAGTGPLATSVEEAAGHGINYIGQVAPAEVAQLREKSRFTLAPSSCYEGLPLGVVESMAAGRAVIASRLGALGELVSEGVTGVLVPPTDPGALARAMFELWNDRERAKRLGANALGYAREHFSPIEQASSLARLYDGVLDARRKSRAS